MKTSLLDYKRKYYVNQFENPDEITVTEMVFSSLTFLYIFLPLCLVLYFLFNQPKAKNAVLIVFSILFYAWGEPVYVFLMVGMAAVNWLIGLLFEKKQGNKALLVLALILDLGALAVFKYAGFLVENLNALFRLDLAVPKIALPIGISFYTFQTLSYTIDVYRGKVPTQRSFWRFLLYVSLFPQLIAGPIVRYSDVAPQLRYRVTEIQDAFSGFSRFAIGLAKKVLLADYAGSAASSVLDGALGLQTTAAVWLGVLLFMFEIYFDFSGYSDMAIGIGRILGFQYPENFNLPYASKSITEFWRRWHISLSTFFRDYVYIPLGGNRRHQYRNLLVVWLLTGLWHGASWNFVLWGLYFCLLLMLERKLAGKIQSIPTPIRRVLTLLLILFGWNLFYHTDLSRLLESFRVMFGLGGAGFWDEKTKILLLNNLPLLLFCLIGSSSIPRIVGSSFGVLCAEREEGGKKHHVHALVTFVYALVMLILSTISLVGSSYNAFLYFRF